MENPFTRLRKKHGLTQQAISVRAGCSRHLVIRTEQACFTDPPPVMLTYFAGRWMDGDQYVLKYEYHEFQKEQRAKAGKFLGSINELSIGDAIKVRQGKVHPLTFLRGDINITQLAKKLCMSQSTLHRFENSPMLQKSVPDELRQALMDCGYDEYEVDGFANMYYLHRAHLRGENLVRSTG